MATRSVTVNLSARVEQLEAAMARAAAATEQVGQAAENASQAANAAGEQAATGFAGLSQRLNENHDSLNHLANGVGIAGAALVGVAALGVAKFSEFEQQMSYVQAATHATGAEMDSLKGAAIEAGASSVYSAKEAGQAIEELAKAGVSTSDILGGGLKGSMDLAAAGGVEVGFAAETAASAMTQFGLSGDKVTHIADLLAAGAGKAQGGVNDLSYALGQSGLVASSVGLSIEETTGGLAAFASAGLLGSDAGTSFKTMLSRLNPSTKEARAKFEELGISAYDSEGKFVGLANVAGQLQESMSTLSPEARNSAMQIMFGSDAVRAANILYAQGREGIQGWINNVNDSGYAAETAAMRLDNLAGDWEAFTGALDTALISGGSGSSGVLRSLVQGATELVDKFNEIPSAVQGALGMGAGIAGLALLGVAGMAKVVVSVQQTRAAMEALGISSKAAGLAMAGLGLAVAGATIFLSQWLQNGAQVRALTDQLKDGAVNLSGALTDTGRDTIIAQLQKDVNATDWDQFTAKTGISLDQVATALQKGGSAADEMRAKLSSVRDANLWESFVPGSEAGDIYATAGGIQDSFGRASEAIKNAGLEAKQTAEATSQAGDAAEKAAGGGSKWTKQNQEIAAALAGTTAELDAANAAYAEQIDALNSATDAGLGYYQSQLDVVKAQQEIAKAQKENAKGWDEYTESGQKNQEMYLKAIDSANQFRDSMIKQGELTPEMKTKYDGLVKSAQDFALGMGASTVQLDEMNKRLSLEWPPPNTAAAEHSLDQIALKASAASRSLTDAFGESDIEATFALDTAKFDASYENVWTDAEAFKNLLVAAGADLNDADFNAKFNAAQLKMTFLELQKPTPRADLDPALMYTVLTDVNARLDYLAQQTPTPAIKAQMAELQAVADAAQARIDQIAQAQPAAINAFDMTQEQVLSAQARLDSARQQAPASIRAVDETSPASSSADFNVNAPKQNAPASIAASDDTAPARDSAFANLNAPKQNAPASIAAQDNTGPASAQANASVNAPRQNAPASITAQNNTGPGVNASLSEIGRVPQSKTTVLNTIIRRTFETSGVPFAPDRWAAASANGNIFEAFAQGGLREEHTAQIASAGTMRLWAEPETGGEAYIPLAQAKRSRSEAILSQVAKRFGGEFKKFADGGFNEAEWLRYQQDRSNANGEAALRRWLNMENLKDALERQLKEVGEGVDEQLKSIKVNTDMRLEQAKASAKVKLDALGESGTKAISDNAEARLKAVTKQYDDRLKAMTAAKASTEAKDKVRAERDRVKEQIRAERDAAKKRATEGVAAEKKRITDERDRTIDALKDQAKKQSDALTKGREEKKDALTKQLEEVKDKLPDAKSALDAATAFAQRLRFMQERAAVDATAANATRFERQKLADANPFGAAGAGAYGALKSPADFTVTAARVSEMRAAAPSAEDIKRGGPQAPTVVQNNYVYYPVPERESAVRDKQAAAARNLARR